MSYFWRPYVSVAARRAKAKKEMEKLRKKGKAIQPIELDGRKIASSYWGKGWCDHLESFSDYENRLPRGRTYLRNGSVCHLEVKAGQIEAIVSGSELYRITIKMKSLAPTAWKAIKAKCRGQIGSVLELLQGKLSNHVMTVVSDRTHGLFPHPGEIELKCSCPDWATMCKHVAAVLYGVGNRLDHRPELLFLLRGVDAEELISAEVALPTASGVTARDALGEGRLAEIFGIDIETGDTLPQPSAVHAVRAGKTRRAKTAQPIAASEPKQSTPASETRAAKLSKSAKIKSNNSAVAKTPPPIFDPNTPTGAAVARLRRKTGLPVADFARSLGVSLASVQRWENTPGSLRLYARPLAALTQMQAKFAAQ